MWKEEFIKYLRYEKNYSPLTEISYLNDITQFEEFIKEKDEEITITSIDSDIIRIWISTLIEQGLKPSSVNRKLSTLKSLFKFLLKKEAIDKDPTKLLVGPKTKGKYLLLQMTVKYQKFLTMKVISLMILKVQEIVF